MIILALIALYIFVTVVEYYLLWQAGLRKLKEIDSAQLIRVMAQREKDKSCASGAN